MRHLHNQRSQAGRLNVHCKNLKLELEMSRGLGWQQRYLVAVIRKQRKPMTFAEICAAMLKASEAPPEAQLWQSAERSARHTLHGLVRDQVLITLGKGGRAEPHRYFIHPKAIGFICQEESESKALLQALLDDGAVQTARF